MREAPGGGLTLKAAVLAGFGLTLGLWLYVGYTVARQMESLEPRAAGISLRYTSAQQRLSSVRLQVLLASIAVRDALLDPDPDKRAHVRQISAMLDSAAAELDSYEPLIGSPDEQERIHRLRDEVAVFREELVRVVEAHGHPSSADANALLLDLPTKRAAAMRVSDDVRALNRATLLDQQAVIAAVHTDIQEQVWTLLSVALALGLCIATGAAAYAGRLERRLGQQRALERETTVELKRLSARLIETQEQDFRTIARELHDEVGQLLSAANVELTRASQKVGVGPAAPPIASASALTDKALQAVRNLSHLLHPAVLDDLGLAAALETYTREFGRRHGVVTDCRCAGLDERLPAEAEITAYRIVQEALANVAHHAHATTCDVEVRRTPERVLIHVADDGVGFDPAALGRGARGLGLISMRERVAQFQGTCRVVSAPGEGTRVMAEWRAMPAPAPAAEGERQGTDGHVSPGQPVDVLHG